MPSLLAVDAGLRAGLALFDDRGNLHWYRSRNYGSTGRLRRAAHAVLEEVPELAWVAVEGGGGPAAAWEREARRRDVGVLRTSAETWRRTLLLPRDRRSGRKAKEAADDLARRVIEWGGADRPTSLRHDAAEAILLGVWALLRVGWLEAMPPELRTG